MNIKYEYDIVLFFIYFYILQYSPGDWTQGVTHASKALYHQHGSEFFNFLSSRCSWSSDWWSEWGHWVPCDEIFAFLIVFIFF